MLYNVLQEKDYKNGCLKGENKKGRSRNVTGDSRWVRQRSDDVDGDSEEGGVVETPGRGDGIPKLTGTLNDDDT